MFPQLSAKTNKIILWILIGFALIGGGTRFYHITQNQFFYYDEGMWLNEKRPFVDFLSSHPPQTLSQLSLYLDKSFHLSLTTAKSLWLFICLMRSFFTGADGFYFVRLFSAVCGLLTIGVAFLFAKKLFRSSRIAWFSTIFLALLPSHVYYSRMALQESFSILCFLSGLYLYLFPRKFSFRIFVASFLFACVFFANYRMIITPFLLAFCDVFVSLSFKEKLNVRKYVWTTTAFLCIVFLVGALDNGRNTYVTFAWMFHQAHLARGHFEAINLLSFPYYLFRLESFFFGLLFFGNLYCVYKKKYAGLFPFAFVVLQMILFSFSQEKGVRYLCVAMPFMAMAGANVVDTIIQQVTRRKQIVGLLILLVAIWAHLLVKDFIIAGFKADYKTVTEDIKRVSKGVPGIISSQPMVQSLYLPDPRQVVETPKELKELVALYARGYRYLVIDPQAYISYTQDEKRFSPHLINYMEFLRQNVKPIKVYPHFSSALFERFVLEHNENLMRSIEFIEKNKKEKFSALYLYDVRLALSAIRSGVKQYEALRAQTLTP